MNRDISDTEAGEVKIEERDASVANEVGDNGQSCHNVSARQILQVFTQMKSTPIPLEPVLNREAILKLMAGEQPKRSGDGHPTPPRCSPEKDGSRRSRLTIW